MAAMIPAADARQVVTRTNETASGSAESTDPPLNPNQPSHSRKTPMAASGKLCPMIGRMLPLEYFPIRGPSISTPTRAAHPPTECTSVDPAKS